MVSEHPSMYNSTTWPQVQADVACVFYNAFVITLKLNTMQSQYDAIVIGGGVTGNASALGLAQTGARVAHVCPDETTPSNDALDIRIYALSNPNVALLKRLRVWDALDAKRVCPVSDMHITGDAHRSAADLRGQLHFSTYDTDMTELAWIVEQNNIQKALQLALKFVPNLSTFHTHASALNIRDDGVDITTPNGDVLSAPLLVGADGANSWARQAHHIDHTFFDYEQCGVVANFSCAQPHFNCAHQWFFSNGDVLALLPLPNQQVSMVYSCETAISKSMLSFNDIELAQHISELSQHAVGALTTLTPAQAFPLKRMRANRFIAPHTLLLGDAAHTVHPLAGQGLNLGLQDLSAWLDILAQREPHRAINDPVLLRRYERARWTPTLEMQGITHALNRLFQNPNPIARHARNLGMTLLDTLPPLKRRLIQAAMGQAPTDAPHKTQ